MEGLSNIKERVRLPLNIGVSPYLMDHQFQGRAVLPAVEAMELLAASTQAHLPETPVNAIHNARFDKFLPIERGVKEIQVFNDLEIQNDGTVVSRLLTKTQSKKAKITRTKEHAVLCFEEGSRELSSRKINAVEPPEYYVSAETVYNELVPFGPAYQNLREGVNLWEEMATARVYAPDDEGPDGILGSPFPLDAAFHAACVWGQRYVGVVGFPVGFKERCVLKPTCSGKTYDARILKQAIWSDRFAVNIWLIGPEGSIYEEVEGVLMRDVRGGSIRPPR